MASHPPTMPKKTRGRQKIEIKKIENDKSLAVTFTKRRNGLFKKASELGTLFRAETAFIVFSPTGKPYSYGHPDVETVTDRYLVSSQFESHRNPVTELLTRQLADMLGHLEIAKEDGKELDDIKKARGGSYRWEVKETLEVEEVEKVKAEMLEMKKNAKKQAERLMSEGADPTPTIPIFGPTRVDGAGLSN